MQPSTQDVQVPFDPTSYTSITGAGLLQFGNGIAPGPNTGLSLVTTDVAGVPQVPDANTNVKWQKYIWIRRQATSVTAYVWNTTAASDPALLQWQTITLASIADNSVTNSKISAQAVTNDKIFSVDWSKLTSVPVGLMTAGSLAGGDLTGTYPNPTLGLNVVTATKLQSDAAVDANRAVGTNHIKDASVTAAKLAADAQGGLNPAGVVQMFGGSVAPTGWLECNGAAVSRATFAALFTAIAANHGNGDGVTTFNLPDLRGRFARGWDHGAGRDPDATGRTADNAGGNTGDNVGSLQAAKLQDHTHNPLTVGSTGFLADVPSGGTRSANVGSSVDEEATTGLITGALGGGTETRPKNVGLMFIIKT